MDPDPDPYGHFWDPGSGYKQTEQTNRQKQRKRTGIHIQNIRINIQKKIRQKEASVLDEQQTEKFAKRMNRKQQMET